MNLIKPQNGNAAIGVILILVGIAAGYFGYKELSAINALLEKGQKTQAQIVEIYEFIQNEPGKKNTYSPIVEWVTASGQKVTGKAHFASVRSSDYQVGKQLWVIYDEKNPPENFYVLKDGASPKASFNEYILLIFGAVFIFGGFMTILKGA